MLTLFLGTLLQLVTLDAKDASIAVIGAGLGSASVIHYIYKQLERHWPRLKIQQHIAIDVYEQDLRVMHTNMLY